jgi:hypothetical protein
MPKAAKMNIFEPSKSPIMNVFGIQESEMLGSESQFTDDYTENLVKTKMMRLELE